jgi:hypothetical protein
VSLGLYSGIEPCVTQEVGGRSIPKAARDPIAMQKNDYVAKADPDA